VDRRRFLTGTGGLTLASAGCGLESTPGTVVARGRDDIPPVQSNEGMIIHAWDGDVMRGFPADPANQVTRENFEDSQANLRWAAQHIRELFPTQRVSRGSSATSTPPATWLLRSSHRRRGGDMG
jgi:hypothetical protein